MAGENRFGNSLLVEGQRQNGVAARARAFDPRRQTMGLGMQPYVAPPTDVTDDFGNFAPGSPGLKGQIAARQAYGAGGGGAPGSLLAQQAGQRGAQDMVARTSKAMPTLPMMAFEPGSYISPGVREGRAMDLASRLAPAAPAAPGGAGVLGTAQKGGTPWTGQLSFMGGMGAPSVDVSNVQGEWGSDQEADHGPWLDQLAKMRAAMPTPLAQAGAPAPPIPNPPPNVPMPPVPNPPPDIAPGRPPVRLRDRAAMLAGRPDPMSNVPVPQAPVNVAMPQQPTGRFAAFGGSTVPPGMRASEWYGGNTPGNPYAQPNSPLREQWRAAAANAKSPIEQAIYMKAASGSFLGDDQEHLINALALNDERQQRADLLGVQKGQLALEREKFGAEQARESSMSAEERQAYMAELARGGALAAEAYQQRLAAKKAAAGPGGLVGPPLPSLGERHNEMLATPGSSRFGLQSQLGEGLVNRMLPEGGAERPSLVGAMDMLQREKGYTPGRNRALDQTLYQSLLEANPDEANRPPGAGWQAEFRAAPNFGISGVLQRGLSGYPWTEAGHRDAAQRMKAARDLKILHNMFLQQPTTVPPLQLGSRAFSGAGMF